MYVILAGERRWRAARMAGLDKLSCVIHEGALAEEEKLAMQLVENALRTDLKPVEQARAYRRLMDAKGYSTRDLAAELHIAQTSVVRALALLDLPAHIQVRVEGGELPATVAAELTKLPDAALQAEVAQAVVNEGLTRTEVTELVQAVRARRPAPSRRPEPITIDLGDCSVTVRWKKASETTALQALRKAARQIQGARALSKPPESRRFGQRAWKVAIRSSRLERPRRFLCYNEIPSTTVRDHHGE